MDESWDHVPTYMDETALNHLLKEGRITPLGKGGFGTVVQVNDPIFGRTALKLIQRNEDTEGCREGKVGFALSSPHLVQCLSFISGPTYHFIFTEFCNGGDLRTWLKQTDPHRVRKLTDPFFLQLTKAVSYLHRQKVVHGDLKPDNIFLKRSNDGEITLKIGDFGSAFIVDGNEHKSASTLSFMDKHYPWEEGPTKTTGYDIFSLACIFVLLFASGVYDFSSSLLPNPEKAEAEKEDALFQFLNMVKQEGLESAAPGVPSYQQRSELVRHMIVDPLERWDAEKVEQTYAAIASQPVVTCSGCPIPGKNPLFAGRRKLLNELIALLDNPGTSSWILLHGIAGTGKKTIAADICHHYAESARFPRGIFWFRADSRKILQSSYSHFDRHNEKCKNVSKWLEGNSGWLVVYENVNSYRDIQDLMPRRIGPDCGVILTSRAEKEPPSHFLKFKIPLLSVKHCSSYIKRYAHLRRLECKPSDADCKNLAEAFDQLPAAIGPALAYIANPTNRVYTVKAYLSLHEENLKHKFIQPCHSAYYLTAEEIKKRDGLAFEWLLICSYLYNEGIPEVMLDILLRGHDLQNFEQGKQAVIETLVGYSVMDYEEETLSFSLPRAVQESMQRMYKSSFEKTLGILYSTLREILPVPKRIQKDQDRSVKIRECGPHLESILGHIRKYEERSRSSSASVWGITLPNFSNTKQQESILRIKMEICQSLRVYYSMQNHPTKKSFVIEELMNTRGVRLGDEKNAHAGVWAGLARMGQGAAEMKAALKGHSILPLVYTGPIQKAISLLEVAKDMFLKCGQPGQQYAAQCCLHLARCHSTFLHPRYFIRNKKGPLVRGRRNVVRKETLTPTEKAELGFRVEETIRNYREAITLLVELVQQKQNVFRQLSFALKELSTTFLWTREFILYEKYTVLALAVARLRFDRFDEDAIVKTVSFWDDIYSFDINKVLAEEDLIAKDHPSRSEALFLLNSLIKFHRRPEEGDRGKLTILYKHQGRFRMQSKELKKLTTPDATESPQEPNIITDELSLTEQARVKMSLAQELKRQGKYSEALKGFKEALELTLQYHKRSSVAIAAVHEKIGDCHVGLKNDVEVCKSYKEAYKLWERDNCTQGSIHDFTQLLQKYVRALPRNKAETKIQLLEQCVGVISNRYGSSHVTIGKLLEQVGTIYMKELGKYSEARDHLLNALDLRDQLPPGNQDKINCLQKLIQLSETLPHWNGEVGKYTERLEQEKESLSLKGYQRSTTAEQTKRHKVKKRNRKMDSAI